MLDYLEDNISTSPSSCKLAIDSLSPLLPVILSQLNPALAVRFINLCDQEPRVPHGEPLPEFGLNSRLKFAVSTAAVVKHNVTEKIFDDDDDKKNTASQEATAQVNVQTAVQEAGEKKKKNKIDFQSLMLRLNYQPTSEDMLNVVQTLSTIDNEEIFRTAALSRLIVYLWKPTKKYHLVLAILFSILMIAIFVFFVNKQSDIALLSVIVVLTPIFIVLELIQLRNNGLQHFESFWNYVDAFFLIAVPFKAIESLMSQDADDNGMLDSLQSSWVCVTVIFVGYVRWISFLQIFEPTSIIITSQL